MKNKLSIFALILLMWGVSVSTIFGFSGTWINERSSLPKLKITLDRDVVFVSAWERSQLGMKPLGTVAAQLLTPASAYASQTLKASYDFYGDILDLRLTQVGNSMEVQIKNSLSGVERYTYKKVFTERENRNGSISGKIHGPAQSTASIFQILLYGPNNGNRLIQQQALGRDKTFSFEGLPDGAYWMIVKARGATRILPFPSEKKIIIRDGEAILQNVTLK